LLGYPIADVSYHQGGRIGALGGGVLLGLPDTQAQGTAHLSGAAGASAGRTNAPEATAATASAVDAYVRECQQAAESEYVEMQASGNHKI
jgi:hypothetical protein